ncbi:MAG: hypothetical protein JO336_22950, partial [Acidobacteriia bacterium]|nr:hypothetical protein [Terriglobia bacterium]
MGIREALFLPVIAALCLAALARPRIGLYGYVWFGVMRPDLIAFAEGHYPYSLALAISTALGATRYAARSAVWFRNPFCRLLLLLQIPIGLSVLLAFQPDLATPRYDTYIRMILVILLIPLLIEQPEDAKRILIVIAVSLGFIAIKFAFYGLANGGASLTSGYGEMLGDNNFVALALA